MYAIYGNIYHQYTTNVSINIAYMDPMGMAYCHLSHDENPYGEATCPSRRCRDESWEEWTCAPA